MNKGLTVRTGQTHVQRYLRPLLEMIEEGKTDPSFVVTHTVSLDEAPAMYKKFRDKAHGCIKSCSQAPSFLSAVTNSHRHAHVHVYAGAALSTRPPLATQHHATSLTDLPSPPPARP